MGGSVVGSSDSGWGGAGGGAALTRQGSTRSGPC